MTTESQTFITADEIVRLSLECTCGASVAIPISQESVKRLVDAKLMECPSCHEHWFQGSQDQRLVSITSFVSHLRAMLTMDKNFKLKIRFALKSDPRQVK